MDEQSQSHATWDCKYHVVFANKYRTKRLYGDVRREPLSTSAFLTHSLSVCAMQPILAAIEDTAAHREEMLAFVI